MLVLAFAIVGAIVGTIVIGGATAMSSDDEPSTTLLSFGGVAGALLGPVVGLAAGGPPGTPKIGDMTKTLTSVLSRSDGEQQMKVGLPSF